MKASARKPLFYAEDIDSAKLQLYLRGTVEAEPVDRLDFADEHGGTLNRQLALPFLPGMDAIQLDDARFEFRVADKPLDISGYSVGPGESGRGCVLRLDQPSRLRKVELNCSLAPERAGKMLRLIVRPVTQDGFGPPILATPDFPGPAAIFGRLLAGMSVSDLVGDRHAVTLPDIKGAAWLFQVAQGDKLDELAALDRAITVRRVVIAAEPRNLGVTLLGSPPTPLWSTPGTLGSDSPVQQVSFLPIAQRRLSEALAAASPDAVTLPLSIAFHSDGGGLLEVMQRALSGQYLADPLAGQPPVTLTLGGPPQPLVLSAPGGLRPLRCLATLEVRMLGRSLNPASPPPSGADSATGLRVGRARLAARRMAIAPRDGTTGDAAVDIASIAVRIDTPEASEVSLELHSDAAGQPGPLLVAPIVMQFPARFSGWADFVLAKPAAAAAGGAIWAVMHLTKGLVCWHQAEAAGNDSPATDAPAQVLVSLDQGASWGAPTLPLGPSQLPAAQVFHRDQPPFARPQIGMTMAGQRISADCCQSAVAGDPSGRSWSAVQVPLAPAVLELLAALPPGNGGVRAPTTLYLESRAVCEITIRDMKLFYDPATSRTR